MRRWTSAPLPTVPCHNDLLAENFIDSGGVIRIVDYQLSGNNDPCFELGDIAAEADFDPDRVEALAAAYFGDELTAALLARVRLNLLLSNVTWTLWFSVHHGLLRNPGAVVRLRGRGGRQVEAGRSATWTHPTSAACSTPRPAGRRPTAAQPIRSPAIRSPATVAHRKEVCSDNRITRAGPPHDADEQRLAELGYRQELRRKWSGFSNFAISFSIISILAGCFTTFGQAWNNGGPIAICWGWPLISIFILIIGFCMSELVSAYPTAGGIYWWAAKMGKPIHGWFTGWLNLIGLIAVTASVDYGCATFLNLTLKALLGDGTWAGTLNQAFMLFVIILAAARA